MTRLLTKRLTPIVLFAALIATVSGTAFAYFTTTGTGNASTSLSQLVAPTITAATPAAGGTVALTWSAVVVPGNGTVAYSVSRDGKAAAGTCALTLTTTTCVDSGLAVGTYSYVVTAKWRTWSTVSTVKTAQVTVGPAHHLVLTAASSTPAAGASDNLTITAKDAGNNTVTTYAGSRNLTFSGAAASPNATAPAVVDSAGTATAFGTPTAIDFSAGVATVTSSKNGVMKLYNAGPANVEVSDGSISTAAPLVVTVSPATAAKFVPTAATTTVAAGDADNLTITAQDAYGNTASAYTGSHNLTFSGASASPNGTKPTVVNSSGTAVNFGTATAISFTAGVATVTASKNGLMKLYASGQANVGVSDGSISAVVPLEVTVTSLAAVRLALTAVTTTPAAGAPDNLTITAQDTYGNVASAYAGSHNLTFSGAAASPTGVIPTVSDSSGADIAFGVLTAIDFSSGVATVSSSKNGEMQLYKSGLTSLSVSDGSLSTEAPLAVTVAAATASKFVLGATTTTPAAAASDNLTITAQDTYGNVATAYTGSHNLTFSGASASPNGTKPTVANSGGTAVNFGSTTAIAFTNGVAAITSSTKNGVMKLYASGEAQIAVNDGSISTAAPLEVTVAPLAASKLVLAAATTTPTAGAADNLTTTAQDTYGNIATSYTGSRNLTFSTASASPGGNVPTVSNSSGAEIAFGSATAINFTAGVASVSGATNGVMKLYKVGATSLKVSDGTFTSATISITVAIAATAQLSLAAATTTPVAAATDNLTITAQDAYGNTATTYTGAHELIFSGSSASPSGALPTVFNSNGTAVNFGSATAITFTSGVASGASSKNGVMKLNRAGAATIGVSDGSISDPTPLAVTVSTGAASRLGLTSINISAGVLGSNCLFSCTVTGIGNSGTVTAKVAVTDSVGNTVNALGSGHAVKITTNGGGTIGGTPLAIPSAGSAETATSFTYTSKSSGAFSEIVTAATSEGATYTSAMLTASQ